MKNIFLDFLRFSLHPNQSPAFRLTALEWESLFREASRQAVIGVFYAGIENLPPDQLPPRSLLLKWFAAAERIRQLNRRVDRDAVAVSEYFRQAGFRNAILKGQGVATYYPDGSLRTPGDIDIWLEGGRERILPFVKRHGAGDNVRYHHTDFRGLCETEVEVHFTPSWMNSPLTHRRLQYFFLSNAAQQFSNSAVLSSGESLCMPTVVFNQVYILLHIYRHLLGEGVGFRQLIDYYYTLCQPLSVAERKIVTETIAFLHLKTFASAVMYVMSEVLGLPEENQICKPDSRRGRFLLGEVLSAGNFGQFDTRIKRAINDTPFKRFGRSLRRNARFIQYFPEETLCDPFFKIWLYLWRKKNHY